MASLSYGLPHTMRMVTSVLMSGMDASEAATGECHTSGDIVHMTAAQHLGKDQPLLHQERFQECDCKRCAQGMRAAFPVSQAPRSLPAYLLSFPDASLPSFPYVSRAIAIGQDGDRNTANSLPFQPSSGEAHEHSDLRARWHWPDQGVGGGCSLAGELGQQLPRRLMGAGGGAGGRCSWNRVAIKRRPHYRGSGREKCAFVGRPKARGSGHAQDNGVLWRATVSVFVWKAMEPHREFEGLWYDYMCTDLSP